jgi:hypothetical protein
MEDPITFEQFLVSKKIDPKKFKFAEASKYEELSSDFPQMNAKSFTAQYLFLINPIRRKYLLEQSIEVEVVKKTTMAKPKFKR